MSAIGAPAGVNGQWNQEQLDSLPNITSTFWQPKNEI
jgi:hypothetical protein